MTYKLGTRSALYIVTLTNHRTKKIMASFEFTTNTGKVFAHYAKTKKDALNVANDILTKHGSFYGTKIVKTRKVIIF